MTYLYIVANLNDQCSSTSSSLFDGNQFYWTCSIIKTIQMLLNQLYIHQKRTNTIELSLTSQKQRKVVIMCQLAKFHIFYCHFTYNNISKPMKISFQIICLITCLIIGNTDAVLNNLPVTFTMGGAVTYNPDTGGVQSGYRLTIGYMGASWLGVQFANPGGNSDFLALQISDFYTTNGNPLNTGHQVSYADYNSASLNSSLVLDSITTFDTSSYTYSLTKTYNLQIIRFAGSNSGQDWDGNANKYSVQKICFYTSDFTFDAATFNQYYSACYFYEINNFFSTFVGEHLKNFRLNGYDTAIYGYIDGPIVMNKLYFYQQTPLFAYVTPPAAIIQIGTTAGDFGQDYQVASPIASENGDYYGNSTSTMVLDNFAKGFQNPALTINHWNANTNAQISGLGFTALRISFNRAVYTYDDYDKSMLSTFLFCFYLYASGSINAALSDKACEVVQLSPVYVQMGFKSSQDKIFTILVLTVMILFCLL